MKRLFITLTAFLWLILFTQCQQNSTNSLPNASNPTTTSTNTPTKTSHKTFKGYVTFSPEEHSFLDLNNFARYWVNYQQLEDKFNALTKQGEYLYAEVEGQVSSSKDADGFAAEYDGILTITTITTTSTEAPKNYPNPLTAPLQYVVQSLDNDYTVKISERHIALHQANKVVLMPIEEQEELADGMYIYEGNSMHGSPLNIVVSIQKPKCPENPDIYAHAASLNVNKELYRACTLQLNK